MKKKKAFTLIELLVVIAIIALLMAILMPALARVKSKTKAVLCLSNLKQWAAFFQMYSQHNDGEFPPGWYAGVMCGERWFDCMKPYYGDNNDIVCCPTAMSPRDRLNADGTETAETGAHGKFSAWGEFIGGPRGDRPTGGSYPTSLHHKYGSYGINIYITDKPLNSSTGRDEEMYFKTKNPKNAGEVPVLFDSLWIDVFAQVGDPPPDYDGDFSPNGHIDGLKNCAINRHNGFSNFLMLDYSVRPVGLKEIWELKWHTKWLRDYRTPVAWNDEDHWMFNMKDYAVVQDD